MSLPFFLYRRLSRWITCEFNLSVTSKIALKNKYEVASFKDVFCHPFYWQVFQYISSPPNLVVDCGAHCGHFTILTDICLQSRFSSLNTQYILIEPNPHLIPVIKKNLYDAKLLDRVTIKEGLLGCDTDSTLWIPPQNYLAASLSPIPDAKPHRVKALNISDFTNSETIDLMKIDIEGGEFNFINQNADLLPKVNLIFMELHVESAQNHQTLFDKLTRAGLHMVSKPIESHGQQLIIFQR